MTFPFMSSYPSRDTWIEIMEVSMDRMPHEWSYPSRDTWIEIENVIEKIFRRKVVSLTGYVD